MTNWMIGMRRLAYPLATAPPDAWTSGGHIKLTYDCPLRVPTMTLLIVSNLTSSEPF
jgi:hypothetical protein